MYDIIVEVPPWQEEVKAAQWSAIRQVLVDSHNILKNTVKIPLNVACSDVLRGVLKRSLDSVVVQGHAQIHRHNIEFHSQSVVLAQISMLNSAIIKSLHELDIDRDGDVGIQNALLYIEVVRDMLTVPPETIRFPYKFFQLGTEVGYCGEVFICEKFNVVFNLHAYQDNDQNSFTSTDTVSAKSTDPGLFEVWEKLDQIFQYRD